ncbi:hypothetical protein L3V83_14345 [Thiotrichales bacterium 19X7-9]|nr:hypothetical protein [Thiotrichales bacterium 19X7-9]
MAIKHGTSLDDYKNNKLKKNLQALGSKDYFKAFDKEGKIICLKEILNDKETLQQLTDKGLTDDEFDETVWSMADKKYSDVPDNNMQKFIKWATQGKSNDNAGLKVILDGNKNYYLEVNKTIKNDSANFNEIDKKLMDKEKIKNIFNSIESKNENNKFKTTYESKNSNCTIEQNHTTGIAEIKNSFDAKSVAKMIQINGGKATLSGGWELENVKALFDECIKIGVDINNIKFDQSLQYQNGKEEEFKLARMAKISQQSQEIYEKYFNNAKSMYHHSTSEGNERLKQYTKFNQFKPEEFNNLKIKLQEATKNTDKIKRISKCQTLEELCGVVLISRNKSNVTSTAKKLKELLNTNEYSDLKNKMFGNNEKIRIRDIRAKALVDNSRVESKDTHKAYEKLFKSNNENLLFFNNEHIEPKSYDRQKGLNN